MFHLETTEGKWLTGAISDFKARRTSIFGTIFISWEGLYAFLRPRLQPPERGMSPGMVGTQEGESVRLPVGRRVLWVWWVRGGESTACIWQRCSEGFSVGILRYPQCASQEEAHLGICLAEGWRSYCKSTGQIFPLASNSIFILYLGKAISGIS